MIGRKKAIAYACLIVRKKVSHFAKRAWRGLWRRPQLLTIVVVQKKIIANPHTLISFAGVKKRLRLKASICVSPRSRSTVAMMYRTSRSERKFQDRQAFWSGKGTRKMKPMIPITTVRIPSMMKILENILEHTSTERRYPDGSPSRRRRRMRRMRRRRGAYHLHPRYPAIPSICIKP